VSDGSFVLVADIFDQFGIEHDVQVALGMPGACIDFRIIDSQFDFKAAVVGAPDSLDGVAGEVSGSPLRSSHNPSL
jgi:hypothetical protein